MKKIFLLFLFALSFNCYSQIIGFPPVPPPVGFSIYEKIDIDNDGFVTFEMDYYLNYVKARALSQFGFNLSQYTLHFFEDFNPNPITSATYTNITANQQFLTLELTYNGVGPQYNQTTLVNLFSGHLLRAIPYNGDIDNDGILNYIEDLNTNLLLMDDDTDGDGNQNFRDPDDDNDGILTINEDYNGNGSPLDDDMNANGIPDYLDNQARGSLPLNLKLFIQGYYAGSSTMRSVKFNQDGVSPTTDVENITIELHHTTTPFALAASTTAMLKTNGNVACSFPTASVGSYYIVVKSSNGIETWSATPQSISNTAITYNFSTAANNAYGSNMKNLGGGVFGIYSGDINGDTNIDTIDYPIWQGDSNNFLSGHHATDINGDGNVDTIDYPILEGNADGFISVIRP